VLRIVLFVLLLASVPGFAQESSSNPDGQAPAATPVDTKPQEVSELVIAAESAIASSDWKTAEAKLNPWLASHPRDARALFDAGYAADAQNRLDEAAEFYRRAVEVNPKSFEAHLSLGLLLARQKRPVDARTELIAATNLDPEEAGPALKARAWRALAQIDRPEPGKPGDTKMASNDLLEALKLSIETPADTLLAANLAEQAGQYDEAETAYRRLIEKDAKLQPAIAGLAHLLMMKKQYPEAETLLVEALKQAPDDPALTAQLATSLAAQDKAEALPLIQKLHEAHPADPAITRMLAQVLAQAGDAAGSDKLYSGLLAAAPNDPALLVEHGQNLVRQGMFAPAFAAFDKATQIDPASGDGWSGLAFAASRMSQPAVTLHALTMRSKFMAENASTYFLWATAYDSLHQKMEAATYYKYFLKAAGGKFPNQEWQARQRLLVLEK